jgi:hypothetical protein
MKKFIAWVVKWPDNKISRTYHTKAEAVESACRFFEAGQKVVKVEIREIKKRKKK